MNSFDEKDEYSKTNIGDIFDGGSAYSGLPMIQGSVRGTSLVKWPGKQQ